MDINNLRVLNDYLNQTIDTLSRQQAINPLAAQSIFGQVPGLSHSAYTPFAASPFAASPFATPFTTPYTSAYASPWAQVAPVVDPFMAQRGLSHTAAFGASAYGVNPWQQQQLTHAIAARAQVLEAMCRSLGIPV